MLTLSHSTAYAAGEPLVRFASQLDGARWLCANGFRFVCRLHDCLIFEVSTN